MIELHSPAELLDHLAHGRGFHGVRLQGVDLSGAAGVELVESQARLDGLVVLGGIVPPAVAHALRARGAMLFPSAPDAPVDPYRSRLYSPTELYAHLEHGYDATVDAQAYRWFTDGRTTHDAYVTALRALHDDAMSDALAELLTSRRCVGIMGGHAWRRDEARYRDLAHAARQLVDSGRTVITGGGPGAMEAANVGALCRKRPHDLDTALDVLGEVPTFTDVTAWARAGFTARALIIDASAAQKMAPPKARSIGIPTWFYGHEPPNVFADAIAKYFSNALREDQLLAASSEAIIVLPGAAGTVQEIFQAVTPLYYARAKQTLTQLVLVDREHWTRTIPVWPALNALAQGRPMAASVSLVDGVHEAVNLLGASTGAGTMSSSASVNERPGDAPQ